MSRRCCMPGKLVRVLNEIVRLQRIDERHPDQVAPYEHPAKVFVLEVPGGQDCVLVPEKVRHVEKLKGNHQAHGRGQCAVLPPLRGGQASVDRHPADQPRSAFAKELQVKRSDAWIARGAEKVVAEETSSPGRDVCQRSKETS